MDLNEIRSGIDRIDADIIKLLSQRSALVSEAGKLKESASAVRDQERVEKVISKIKQIAVKEGLDPEIAEKIYRNIIDCFIDVEMKEFGKEGIDGTVSFFRENNLPAKQVLEGITLKSVSGEKTMMTFFDFEPDAVIPFHKHPHEQITYIIEGEMEFTLEGVTRILRAGEGVVIPPDQEHGARVQDKPAKAVDAWYPIREDYR
ncbi:MAG: cupin domain-containing protein [Deferribacteres bacterium]|nr:cupin domain-containing protein [Deferribacteres bacterium]